MDIINSVDIVNTADSWEDLDEPKVNISKIIETIIPEPVKSIKYRNLILGLIGIKKSGKKSFLKYLKKFGSSYEIKTETFMTSPIPGALLLPTDKNKVLNE